MLVNPITIRMSRHQLDTLYDAAAVRLTKLVPGSELYRETESALSALYEALYQRNY